MFSISSILRQTWNFLTYVKNTNKIASRKKVKSFLNKSFEVWKNIYFIPQESQDLFLFSEKQVNVYVYFAVVHKIV